MQDCGTTSAMSVLSDAPVCPPGARLPRNALQVLQLLCGDSKHSTLLI